MELGTQLPKQDGIDKQISTWEPTDNRRNDPFPQLSPGRALINLETNELIEFYHAPNGVTKPMGGFYAGYNQGFKNDHIITQRWIAHRTRDCPPVNAHDEIPVTDTPDESDITIVKPQKFKMSVLEKTGETPFLIAERSLVAPEETTSTDTYSIIGWYYPYDDKNNRIHDVDKIDTVFEGVSGRKLVEPTATRRKYIDFGIEFDWNHGLDFDDLNIVFGMKDDQLVARPAKPSQTAELHVHSPFVQAGTVRASLDSPYEAKKYIYQNKEEQGTVDAEALSKEIAEPRWNPEKKSWVINVETNCDSLNRDPNSDAYALTHAIKHLVANYGPISITGPVFKAVSIESNSYAETEPLGNDTDVDRIKLPPTTGSSRDESAELPEYDIATGTYRTEIDDTPLQAVRSSDPDKLGFMRLTSTLSDGTTQAVSLDGLEDLSEIPAKTAKQWNAKTNPENDSLYAYYHPKTGTEIKIKGVTDDDLDHTIWGGDATFESKSGETVTGEFAIELDELWNDEPEIVASLADEQIAVQTVITHMMALTQ